MRAHIEVGDLVTYRIGIDVGIGIISRTPEQTNNGDYEVYFGDKRQWCRECYLERVNASR